MDKPRLGDLLREAHAEARIRTAIRVLDKQKLAHTLIELATIFSEVELKFGDPRVPGYTDVLSMQEGKRHEQVVLFWKTFEMTEGVRVRDSGASGLVFSWKQSDNDLNWREPNMGEELFEQEFSDVQAKIIAVLKRKEISSGEQAEDKKQKIV